MLTGYFSCYMYKLNNKSTPGPLPRGEKCTRILRLSNCQCNLSFWDMQTLVLISKRKKVIFFFIFYTCIPEKALITLLQRLHSIITYVWCYSTLKASENFPKGALFHVCKRGGGSVVWPSNGTCKLPIRRFMQIWIWLLTGNRCGSRIWSQDV